MSAGNDGTVRVWNRRSGEERATLTGHTDWVRTVAVTPDGEEVVSAGDDGTVRVWNRGSARQVRGTDLGGAGAARPLAGLRSDEPSTEDLLGIAAEVETMAALVAAVSTEAPLAIGLLGDWGSGKSSFMRQMELQVRELAALSANNLGQTEFVAKVCQVRFNAWHYSDEQVWTGLVEHLFRALASAGSATSENRPHDPARSRELERQLRTAQEEYTESQRDLGRLADQPRPVGVLLGLGSARELSPPAGCASP